MQTAIDTVRGTKTMAIPRGPDLHRKMDRSSREAIARIPAPGSERVVNFVHSDADRIYLLAKGNEPPNLIRTGAQVYRSRIKKLDRPQFFISNI